MKRSKICFEDSNYSSLVVNSSWKAAKEIKSKSSVSCQTGPEICDFSEMETQSGIFSDIIQDQVKSKRKNLSLVEHFCSKHKNKGELPEKTHERWRNHIENGFVTVDGERVVNPDSKLDTDFVLEFTDVQSTASTQTVNTEFNFKEGKDLNERMQSFLRKVCPLVFTELDNNLTCTAFKTYDLVSSLRSNVSATGDSVSYWKLLSADLEKYRVIYPDWNNAKYKSGHIVKCVVTRNKERIYDVEYDDGVKLFGVREEYTRLLAGYDHDKRSTPLLGSRLQEGVRVHMKSGSSKNGQQVFLPGRIVKCTRGGGGTGGGGGAVMLYDIEVEGTRVESGRLVEDLIIGLSEGQQVSARRPAKITLQCTGLSWNATGNSIAGSYGKNDILGWCDYPGAVCCWNVFSKGGRDSDAVPDFVLDHTSCLTCVAYHPVVPSLIAAGSFNGEILMWDLSAAQAQQSLQPFALSPVVEYGHKEPVSCVRWMFDPTSTSSSEPSKQWILCSVGVDGKILYWSPENRCRHPIKGVTLSKKHKSSSSGSQRRYPAAHGITALSFSNTNASGGGSSFVRPTWLLLGQEGGSIIRGQISRMIGGAQLTQESFKSLPAIETVFPPFRRDNFVHQPHIGSVSVLDCSPFHRNLFLSAGADGIVKLFHVLERDPIRTWEPLSSIAHQLSGDSGAVPFISALQFSPHRASVFAVASSCGDIFLYDLVANPYEPCQVLSIAESHSVTDSGTSDNKRRVTAQQGVQSDSQHKVGITSVAFNNKQRYLIAACDMLGRIHTWRLGWSLANKHRNDISTLNELANSVLITDSGDVTTVVGDE